MKIEPRDGEFIGSGMRAAFLKEKLDLAHCRGYAVLIKRVTSPDDPDDKAVYNLYQIDANKGLAAPDMYEALKAIQALPYIKLDLRDDDGKKLLHKVRKALTKARG